MDALVSHPFALLAMAWLASRLGVLVEVRSRVGAGFSLSRYLELRWPQILHGAFWTLIAYGLLVALGKATPEFAFGAGLAADQIVERVTGVKARGSRQGVPGEAQSDITLIANQYNDSTPEAARRDEA